jgi:hypothetical protein
MPRYRMTIVSTLDTPHRINVKGIQADLGLADAYWRADSYDWPVTTVRVERVWWTWRWPWPSWRLWSWRRAF